MTPKSDNEMYRKMDNETDNEVNMGLSRFGCPRIMGLFLESLNSTKRAY